MKVAVIYNKPEIGDEDVINVFGKPNTESYSPDTIEKVALCLEKGGHNVRIIEGNMNVMHELQNFMPRVVSGETPGMVFNMAYGIQGQSRYTHIPAMLEMVGVPYVGSDPSGHAIALDKIMTKIVFLRYNIPTPAFWVFSNSQDDLSTVEYPVIVKPKMEAVSFGLRVVDNDDDLREAILYILTEFQQQALVEAFIPGREFAVGILGNGASIETLPILEIDFDGDPNAIQTEGDKRFKPRKKVCPAHVDEEQAKTIRELAIRAFNALNLRDFARVDMRMDADGNLHILEINSMASLGGTGSYVQAGKAAGYDFTALVNKMLDVAAVRYFGMIETEEIAETPQKKSKSEPLHIRLRSYLRSQFSTFEDYLRAMVSINSYTYNVDGVNALGNFMSARFQNLGFHKQIFPQTEVGNILYFKNHDSDTNDVLLLAHMDTYYDHRDYIPYSQARGKIFGSGIAESKGGLTIILLALQALRFTRSLRPIKVGVLLTTDDLLAGRQSKNHIAEISRHSHYAIGMKYGLPNGGIVSSCGGSREYEIKVTGLKNGNDTPEDMVSVISGKIQSWKKLASEERGISVAFSSLHAQNVMGKRSNYSDIVFEVRFRDKISAELDEKIISIAEKGMGKKLQVQIKRGARRLPVLESEQNKKFYNLVETIAKKIEVRTEALYRSSSSDICHIPEGIAVLDGFGPIGADIRSSNEHILKESLLDRATLLSMVIYRCSKEIHEKTT